MFRGLGADGGRYRVVLATHHNPRPSRRALAAFRVARALRLRVVPRTEARRLSVAALTELLHAEPAALALVEPRVVVGNDGAVAALVQRECPGRELRLGPAGPFRQWAAWAASLEPLEKRAAQSTRDYVEMAVLDFLVGNVGRHAVFVEERSGRLCLAHHTLAFPGFVAPEAMDLLLERLRPVVRYPPGLAAALKRFDRQAARAALQGGPFASWLVGPREIVDLTERRTTLLTLVRARLDAPRPRQPAE